MMFPIILLNVLKLNFLNSYFIIFPYPRISFQLLSEFSLLIYGYDIGMAYVRTSFDSNQKQEWTLAQKARTINL